MRQAKRRYDSMVFANELAKNWGKAKANTEDVNDKDNLVMDDFEKNTFRRGK